MGLINGGDEMGDMIQKMKERIKKGKDKIGGNTVNVNGGAN
jgi:hypothetical protein